jgi:hypothetical protein
MLYIIRGKHFWPLRCLTLGGCIGATAVPDDASYRPATFTTRNDDGVACQTPPPVTGTFYYRPRDGTIGLREGRPTYYSVGSRSWRFWRVDEECSWVFNERGTTIWIYPLQITPNAIYTQGIRSNGVGPGERTERRVFKLVDDPQLGPARRAG